MFHKRSLSLSHLMYLITIVCTVFALAPVPAPAGEAGAKGPTIFDTDVTPLGENPLSEGDAQTIKARDNVRGAGTAISYTKQSLLDRVVGLSASVTRQPAGAQALYKRCAPGVVLLVAPDSTSLGSGCVSDEEGAVITNWHVTKGFDKMFVVQYTPGMSTTSNLQLANCRMIPVVAEDPSRDLALLRLTEADLKSLKPLVFGDGAELSIASDVFSIGHPKGFLWAYTYGVVSQLVDDFEWSGDWGAIHQADLIQTTTPTNPGNSGGPLFNEDGALVGINTFKDVEGENLNFAIRVSEIRDFLEGAREGKYPPKRDSAGGGGTDVGIWLMIDANGNGKPDLYLLDSNGDGYYDVGKVDEDEDGTIEHFAMDTNGDHEIDMYVYDKDGDGHFEYWVIDADHNGELDVVGVDENGDSEPDVFMAYAGE